MARIRTDNIRRNLNEIIDQSTYRPWTASSEAQTRFGAILDKSGRLLTLKQANAKAIAAGREKFTAGEFGQLASELQNFTNRVTLRGEKRFQKDLLETHVADVTKHGAVLTGLTDEEKKEVFREADDAVKSGNLPSDQFYVIFSEKAAAKRLLKKEQKKAEADAKANVSDDIIIIPKE